MIDKNNIKLQRIIYHKFNYYTNFDSAFSMYVSHS